MSFSFSSFFSKKTREETIALFDITSGSVGGALAHVALEKMPRVLFSLREEMPVQELFNFERFFSGMIQTLAAAAQSLEKECRRQNIKPHRITCVFSSPWYNSKTKLIHRDYPEPFTVTKKFLTDFIEQHSRELIPDEEKAPARSAVSAVRSEITEDNAFLAERAVIALKLNGYETDMPEGKRAQAVDIALFASAVSDEVLERIRLALGKIFPEAPITPASTALITYSLFRTLFPDKKNALLVRIGGEISDVGLVKDGVLLESLSLPFGEETLVRTLVKTLGRTPVEVRSLLRLEHTRAGNDGLSLRLKAALMGPERQWNHFFDEALAHFREEGIVPRDVFVMADITVHQWFIDRMENKEYEHHPLTSGAFSVTTVESGLIKKEVVCAANVPCDFFLTEEVLFTDKAFQQSS